MSESVYFGDSEISSMETIGFTDPLGDFYDFPNNISPCGRYHSKVSYGDNYLVTIFEKTTMKIILKISIEYLSKIIWGWNKKTGAMKIALSCYFSTRIGCLKTGKIEKVGIPTTDPLFEFFEFMLWRPGEGKVPRILKLLMCLRA